MKALEDENRKLKQLLADQFLDNQALRVMLDAAKTLGPSGVRELVRAAQSELHISQRRACVLAGVSRSTMRYQGGRRRDDSVPKARLKDLATQRRRYGSPRLTVLLRREGFVDNHKRIERIYSEEGLQVRRRKRKRTARGRQVKLVETPTRQNERWSMDFVRDMIAGGGPLRCLNIVDDFTRECPHIETDLLIDPGRSRAR